MIGLIPKNFLVVIISKRVYYSDPHQKYFVINGHLKKYLKENLKLEKNSRDHDTSGYGNEESYLDHKLDKTAKSWNKIDGG